VRAKGERVVPVCRFVVSYMRRHREEADLLAS
jgi:predicted GNAT family acetyltransferase